MSAHKKLMQARITLQNTKLSKSGHNKFAGYQYFELGDFLPTVQNIFSTLGLCGIVSYTADIASLTITDTDDGSVLVITSPMGSAALKGCHEVQNIGAVESYQRRYLWVTAMEIVEHDVLDSVTGRADAAPEAKPNTAKEVAGDVFRTLSPDMQTWVCDLAAEVEALMGKEGPQQAYEHILDNNADAGDLQLALWYKLESKTRSGIKKYASELKAKNGQT
jgi:hypothetical protein